MIENNQALFKIVKFVNVSGLATSIISKNEICNRSKRIEIV